MVLQAGLQGQLCKYDDAVDGYRHTQGRPLTVLRPVSWLYIQNLAQRHTLQCSQRDDAEVPQLQQRHHLYRMWILVAHAPV